MTKISTAKTSLDKLIESLRDNPMRAARDCRDAFQTLEKAHHEMVHDMIAFIVAFVLHLEQSAAARTAFLTDHYWTGKPQSPKEKNLTRLAVMYMVGAKQSYGALYQQALQYTKVAKHFLEMDIEPEAIPEELQRTPIYKLLDKLEPPHEADGDNDEASVELPRVQPRAAPTGATVHSDVKRDERDSHDDDDDGDEAEDGDKGSCSDDDEEDSDAADKSPGDDKCAVGSGSESGSERRAGISGAGTKKVKRYPFRQNRELAVVAESDWKLFFDGMEPYDEVPVMIRRLPDVDGWAKFEVSDLLTRREYRVTR